MSELVLDLRGLKCPLPALKTRKALASLAPGTMLSVQCTDPLAAIDIPHLLRQTGDTLVRRQAEEGGEVFVILKTEPRVDRDPAPPPRPRPRRGPPAY